MRGHQRLISVKFPNPPRFRGKSKKWLWLTSSYLGVYLQLCKTEGNPQQIKNKCNLLDIMLQMANYFLLNNLLLNRKLLLSLIKSLQYLNFLTISKHNYETRSKHKRYIFTWCFLFLEENISTYVILFQLISFDQSKPMLVATEIQAHKK